jgi:DNA-binding NtrC family response regulator
MSSFTLSVDEGSLEGEAQLERRRLGFVILWSRDEPHRIGERGMMPSDELGTQAILGRGEPESAETFAMTWQRVQPGRVVDTGPLRAKTISRQQLQITVRGPRLLEIENLGRSPLVHEQQQVKTVKVSPGDLIELHARLMLMVVEEAPKLDAHELPAPHTFGLADEHGIVGESPITWQLRAELLFCGRRDAAHVLVRGPSGTGKELVARAIHRCSARRDAELISRNAATFPDTLVDAELFGNAKGYPQAGMPQRPGLIGEADGTTLFLDEFAELPETMQVHLLRVLDAGEYTRLGEARARHSNMRLVAATNRPLSAIKSDLLARFKLRIELVGLSQRREDVPLLARHLLRGIAIAEPDVARRYFPDGSIEAEPRMSAALIDRLVRRPYTTHVREIEALLWRAIARSPGDVVELWHEGDVDESPEVVEAEATVEPEPEPAGPSEPAVDPLSIPPERIQAVLDEHDGRQEPTWRALGLSSRHVLTRLVKRYGLQVRGRSVKHDE